MTLEQFAVEVLSDSGNRRDAPYLLRVLTAAADTADWCATESPVRGLGRLSIVEATDALVHAWEATTHSLAGEALLAGLRGCAPATVDGFAVEGLDDCEADVQLAAVATAPDTLYVRAPLAELREDPLAGRSREAAQDQLIGRSGGPSGHG